MTLRVIPGRRFPLSAQRRERKRRRVFRTDTCQFELSSGGTGSRLRPRPIHSAAGRCGPARRNARDVRAWAPSHGPILPTRLPVFSPSAPPSSPIRPAATHSPWRLPRCRRRLVFSEPLEPSRKAGLPIESVHGIVPGSTPPSDPPSAASAAASGSAALPAIGASNWTRTQRSPGARPAAPHRRFPARNVWLRVERFALSRCRKPVYSLRHPRRPPCPWRIFTANPALARGLHLPAPSPPCPSPPVLSSALAAIRPKLMHHPNPPPLHLLTAAQPPLTAG
jgi:hypothetical protein